MLKIIICSPSLISSLNKKSQLFSTRIEKWNLIPTYPTLLNFILQDNLFFFFKHHSWNDSHQCHDLCKLISFKDIITNFAILYKFKRSCDTQNYVFLIMKFFKSSIRDKRQQKSDTFDVTDSNLIFLTYWAHSWSLWCLCFFFFYETWHGPTIIKCISEHLIIQWTLIFYWQFPIFITFIKHHQQSFIK